MKTATRKFKRVCAGYYQSVDGRVEVSSVIADGTSGYHTKGEVTWYISIDGDTPDDTFYTKRDAMAAVEECVSLFDARPVKTWLMNELLNG